MNISQTEVGPNDIVIHLVNPYKCGDCGSEFFLRNLFIEHLESHIEKLKAEMPCHQIVCGTSQVEQQASGITVTRDILQINEQQVFELQDPSIDYNQLTPLKTLEQAGIIILPKQPQKPPPPKSSQTEVTWTMNLDQAGVKPEGRKVSLLQPRQQQQQQLPSLPQEEAQVHVQVVNAPEQNILYEEPQISARQIQENDPNFIELDAIVQRAFFGEAKIKKEYSVMVEPKSQSDLAQALGDAENEDFDGIEDKSVHGRKAVMGMKNKSDKSVACPICSNVFANAAILERHQVIHTGAKPYSCMVCFRSFNDITSQRKHALIHKRQYRCPICHRMYLRRSQLSVHMKHHNKKRFIQFGNSFHEVRVDVTRNAEGQLVQEYSLLILLSDEELKKMKERDTDENQRVNTGEDEEEAILKGVDNTGSMAGIDKPEQVSVDRENANREVSLAEDSQRSSEQKKKIIYKCGHCKKMIFTRPTLSRHLIKHTNMRPFQCEKCPKKFRDKADLFHHYKTHTKPVKCKTCNSSFSKLLYLQNHLLKGCPVLDNDNRFTVLEDLRCQCHVCGKILKSKSNVLRHLRVHAFQQRNKNVSQAEDPSAVQSLGNSNLEEMSPNVEDHMKALECSVGYECLICGQEFRFKSFMITHIRMHLNQRPFKCDECPKTFYARHMLKKHQQNHTRPYKCPICGKGFIRRYLMKDHFKKRHEQVDPLKDITELHDQKLIQCDICGKTMKSFQKSLMVYHIRLHKDVRPYQCQVCEKAFISDNALKKHSQNHTKPYVCQVCNKGFARRYLLTDHFKKKCSRKKVAKVATANKSSASSKTDTNEENNADIEGKGNSVVTTADAFTECKPYEPNVITELNTATGATTYVCEPCDKRFTVYDALARHINTFSKPSKCKYCDRLYEDKHLTMAHQRSCLGPQINPVNVKGKKTQILGDQQEKIQKIMKEINEKIESITTQPSDSMKKAKPQEFQIVISNNKTHTEENTQANESPEQNASSHTEIMDKTPAPTSSVLTRTVLVLKEDKGKYPCPECDRTFSTLRGLKIHASSHVRLYKCEVCNKDFTQISRLRAHAEQHKAREEDTEEVSAAEQTATKRKREELCESEEDGKASAKIQNSLKNGVSPSKSSTPCNARKSKLDRDCAGDSDTGDNTVSTPVEHKDMENVKQKLMQSGTRGRPFSCTMCRRRFTEQSGLEGHMVQIHGVKFET